MAVSSTHIRMLTERGAPRSLENTRMNLLNIMSKRLEETMIAAGDNTFDDLTEVSDRRLLARAGRAAVT